MPGVESGFPWSSDEREMPVLSLEAAEKPAAETLIRCGTAPAAAMSVARALVGAEADDLKTHGIMRLAAYGEQVKVGKIAGAAVVTAEAGDPPGTGQLILAIDAGAFAGDATERFALLARPIEEQDGARLPGARRFALRARAPAKGSPFPTR